MLTFTVSYGFDGNYKESISFPPTISGNLTKAQSPARWSTHGKQDFTSRLSDRETKPLLIKSVSISAKPGGFAN